MKLTTLLTLTLLSVQSIFGQFYIESSFGYAMGLNGVEDEDSHLNTNYISGQNVFTRERIKNFQYLSAGPTINTSIGWLSERPLSFRFQTSYHLGNQGTVSQTIHSTSDSTIIDSEDKQTYRFTGFKWSPCFTVRKQGEKWSGEIAVGPSFLILGNLIRGSQFIEEFTDLITPSQSGVTSDDAYVWKYYGGIGIGATGSFSALYHVNKSISISLGLSINALQWSPKYGMKLSHIYYGQDIFDDLPTSDKEIIFSSEYTVDGPIDTSEPLTTLKVNYPLSSIDFKIGLRIKLNQNQEEHDS